MEKKQTPEEIKAFGEFEYEEKCCPCSHCGHAFYYLVPRTQPQVDMAMEQHIKDLYTALRHKELEILKELKQTADLCSDMSSRSMLYHEIERRIRTATL